MITEYETINGEQICILDADRIYAGRLVKIEDPSDFQYAVLCDIEHKTHALAVTGTTEKDRLQAIFHANAIKCNIKVAS